LQLLAQDEVAHCVSRRVGPGGGVEDIIYGVEVVFHPYTLLNNQLFIESGWNMSHEQ